MRRDWEATFRSWGAPPGETERTKCENAERAIRKAVDASASLSGKDIEIFTQGSYANRTNVRQDSDVDICVLHTGAFFADYSSGDGLGRDALGFVAGAYSYAKFKTDLEAALIAYFGRSSLTRGRKAFDVHANTYRVDADVVPCFEHRRYMGTLQNHYYLSGTELHPDNGGQIINWPRHHYANGVEKNDETGRRFKAVTRILKRLRYEMMDEGIDAADPIPSYLIECLVWNVPNALFGNESITEDVRSAIAHVWGDTRTPEKCKEWGEINELKYLFRPSQPWRREQANAFLQAAWAYLDWD